MYQGWKYSCDRLAVNRRRPISLLRIDTFGKVFGIDRRDLVNDDLGLFEDTARAMGKAAMRKLAVSWRVYMDFGAALCDHRAAVRSAGA